MALPRAGAVFSGRLCRLLDISVTGALIQLDVEPAVDSVASLVLKAGANLLRLDARVVRVTPVPSSAARPKWTAGLAFLDASPANQRAVARFYTLIAEEQRKKRQSGTLPV